MPSKTIDISGIGPVRFVKSSRNKSIRLSVSSKGTRVSMPYWTPYAVAAAFVRQHRTWILQQTSAQQLPVLLEGHKIGKLHVLHFETVASSVQPRTRATATKLVVQHHHDELPASELVQSRARTAAVRALRREAAVVLPERLSKLAKQHEVSYTDVVVKPLQRRWGSCDSHRVITLNIYLMQLSWQQIDYVICHELAHVRHMNHSEVFWAEVSRMLPDAKMIAKKVRHIQPMLTPIESTDTFDDDMAY